VLGRLPAILSRLGDSVEWEYGVNSTDVPWSQPRRGRAGVTDEEGNIVVALIDFEATVKATGRAIREEDEAISGTSIERAR
jgi:hypothetical protein